MEQITKIQTPPAKTKDVIFLVPPDLYSNQVGTVTKQEMDYLLDHPDRAGKVWIVFGAYNMINEKWYRQNSLQMSETKRVELLASSLTKWLDIILKPDEPKS